MLTCGTESWGEVVDSLRAALHPADFWEVGDTKKGLTMGDMAGMQRFVWTTPVGERKLAILPGASTWRAEVTNALLKLLEEPPAYLHFLLLSEQDTVLPTLRSRIHVYPLVGKRAISVWGTTIRRCKLDTGVGRLRAKELLYLTPLLHASSNAVSLAESVTHELTFL